MAGVVGGGLGASAFLATSALLAGTALGEPLSRFVGAAILGLAIGSMVALVEVIFRKNWLEVRYGANEVRHVNLGDAPVSIGSNSKACIVWTPVAPPVALTYTLRDGRLTCTDGTTGETEPVLPGDTRKVGSLEIVARGSEATEVPAAARTPSRSPGPPCRRRPRRRPRRGPCRCRPPGRRPQYAPPGPRRCPNPRPGPRRCPNSHPGPRPRTVHALAEAAPQSTPRPVPPAPIVEPASFSVPVPAPVPEDSPAASVASPPANACPTCGRPVQGAAAQRYCLVCDITF